MKMKKVYGHIVTVMSETHKNVSTDEEYRVNANNEEEAKEIVSNHLKGKKRELSATLFSRKPFDSVHF